MRAPPPTTTSIGAWCAPTQDSSATSASGTDPGAGTPTKWPPPSPRFAAPCSPNEDAERDSGVSGAELRRRAPSHGATHGRVARAFAPGPALRASGHRRGPSAVGGHHSGELAGDDGDRERRGDKIPTAPAERDPRGLGRGPRSRAPRPTRPRSTRRGRRRPWRAPAAFIPTGETTAGIPQARYCSILNADLPRAQSESGSGINPTSKPDTTGASFAGLHSTNSTLFGRHARQRPEVVRHHHQPGIGHCVEEPAEGGGDRFEVAERGGRPRPADHEAAAATSGGDRTAPASTSPAGTTSTWRACALM